MQLRRSVARSLWEPGTRVRITHDPDHGTVVANTDAAMAATLTAHGLVPAGARRWHLPGSTHRGADLNTIEALQDVLRHRHQVAVSIRLHATTVA